MSATASGVGARLKVDLQAQIDGASDGAVVFVPPDEYWGPFVLRKAITLRGGPGSTLTSGLGPVVVVDSPGVVLENLIIEVAGDASAAGPEGCALQVNSGNRPRTIDLRVKGSVIGVPGEEGIWNLPPVFEFKTITAIPGVKSLKKFQISVPAACTLVPEIVELEVTPASLAPGAHTLELGLEVGPGANVSGDLRVSTPLVWRGVRVTANAAGGGAGSLFPSILTTAAPVSPQVAPPFTPRPVSPSPTPLVRPVYSPPPPPPATRPPVPSLGGGAALKPRTPMPGPMPPPVLPPAPGLKPRTGTSPAAKPAVRVPSKKTPPGPFMRRLPVILVVALVLAAAVTWLLLPGDFNFKELAPLPSVASAGSVVTALTFSPNAKFLAEGTADHAVKLIQVSGADQKWLSSRHDGAVRVIAFSPDGQKLASGGEDAKVVLYTAATGEIDKMLRGYTGAVDALAFSPDGKRLAAGLRDHTIRIWDAANGELLKTFARHDGPVDAVAFSSDGGTLATGGDDNKLILWNSITGDSKDILRGFTGGLLSIALSDGGRIVAAGFQDGSIRVWAAGNPMPTQTLHGHGAPVRSVVFSPNGKSLASLSADATLVLWRTSDGDLTRTVRGFGGSADQAAVSSGCSFLAGGGAGGAIKLWKLE